MLMFVRMVICWIWMTIMIIVVIEYNNNVNNGDNINNGDANDSNNSIEKDNQF